jgi:NAD(P)-dependent dehydrogenase (short-subunit alcohol dehydrogenase family)
MPDGKRWIMVTGGTGGIGKALVARLAAEGRNVIATAREPDRVSGAIGRGRIVGVRLDMERLDTIAAAAGEAAKLAGSAGLSGLVNMAGIIVEGPVEAIPPAELRRQLDINVVGPLALTQALLRLLKAARGRVINIGAISAHLTVPFYGPIAASKSALASLNDAMRLEFAQFGIEVILIEPGAMKTGIFSTSRAMRDATLAALPAHERHYRPALVAMDRAFEKAGADNPDVVVDAVLHALFAKRPKPRIVVGKGTSALLMLSRLPTRTRDRLVKRALGLSAALKPAA